jgi:hypothetical protein
VDRQDRVVGALLPAGVDDFLAAALDLGLPRCTDAKSRSAVLVPVAIDEAAPPPRPISMPGPPSWIISVPGPNLVLKDCSAWMLPRPPAIMIGLW